MFEVGEGEKESANEAHFKPELDLSDVPHLSKTYLMHARPIPKWKNEAVNCETRICNPPQKISCLLSSSMLTASFEFPIAPLPGHVT